MYILHISETLQCITDGTNNQNALTYTYLNPEDVSSYILKGHWSLVKTGMSRQMCTNVFHSLCSSNQNILIIFNGRVRPMITELFQ